MPQEPRFGRASSKAVCNNGGRVSQIFISYRRADSASVSGRIYERLVARFGKDMVFKDVDSIPAAADFRTYIEQVIPQCAVQLLIVGQRWLDAIDRSGRRLENPDDPVRLEIETALRYNIPVLPLLVEEGVMPPADRLPSSLQPIAYRNALPVRYDPDFDNDMRRVIAAVDSYVTAAVRAAQERDQAEAAARIRAARERGLAEAQANATFYQTPSAYSPPVRHTPAAHSPPMTRGTTPGLQRVGLYMLTGLIVLSISGLAIFRDRLFPSGAGSAGRTPITSPTGSPAITNQHFLIATELPVSGTNGAVGLPTQYGVDLAVEQNQNLGHGNTLEIIHKNDEGASGANPSIGATNIQGLINDPQVIAVVGPFNSSVAAAEIPLVNNAGGPVLISPVNTNPGLTLQQFASARG